MSKITVDIQGQRVVYWDGVDDQAALMLVQALVQSLGPAQEDL